MRPWVVVVLAACGGSAPAPEPVHHAATIAPPTCADVGAILRGPITSDDPNAGSNREAAIALACRDDHWPPELLACLTRSRKPPSCLDRLPPKLAANYQARLMAWETTYGTTVSDTLDIAGPTATVACQDVAEDIDHYAGDVTVEHDWVLAARKRVIASECASQPWQETTKECLVGAAQSDPLTSCLLMEPSKDAFAKRLAEIDDRAARMAASEKKPAAISCAKVTAIYYADATWQSALDQATPAARKKVIASSRAAMQKACTADKWDPTLRACLVTGGSKMCFDDTLISRIDWGYPSLAALGKSLPAECIAYKQTIAKLDACNAITPATRDALVETLTEWSIQSPMSAETTATVVTACTAGAHVLDESNACP
jgi:hypothetical protein